MDDMEKNRTGLIRSIIVLTLCIISCTIFLANHKAQLKNSSQNNENPEIIETSAVNAIEGTDGIDRRILSVESVNDMFRSASKAFTEEDNLKTMTITSVKLIGYLSNNQTEKIGIIEGVYSCLDNTSSCLYALEPKKNNDTYKFSMYSVFTLDQNNEYYISSLNDSRMTDSSLYIEDYRELK